MSKFKFCLGTVLPFLILLAVPASAQRDFLKKPNVSGQFYDDDPQSLANDVATFLARAQIEPSDVPIGMVIVPHAGYVYSGQVAAYAYKAVSNQKYTSVILIGPSHHADIDGVSIWAEGAFETPLGQLAVDSTLAREILSRDPRFKFAPQVFEKEHALEVQLPFLQIIFPDVKIVPILMATHRFEDCEKLAITLGSVIGERKDVLIVISTDLSHYRDAKTAESMDQSSLDDVLNLNPKELWRDNQLRTEEMCGFKGVTTALIYAQLQNLKNVKILKYAHSGHVTGDYSAVVGYGAVAFFRDKSQESKQGGPAMNSDSDTLTNDQKKKLLSLARRTVESFVRDQKIIEVPREEPRLSKPEGAFVTLHIKGQLRGCIGRIVSDEPLIATVRDMAIASASEDPRFPPVGQDELPMIDLEISVLSRPQKIKNAEEFKIGVHGAIVRRGLHQGVFLPQVATETGWSREEFLSNLCVHKAGLPADCWKDPKTDIEIFTADVFSEKDFN